jgi:hypothetical protein
MLDTIDEIAHWLPPAKELVGSDTLVAVMVTAAEGGIAEGAV